MIIPIGLLARAISAAHDSHVQSRMQYAAADYERNTWSQELWDACTNDRACLVVLADNDWEDCTFDGVRILQTSGRSVLSLEGGNYRDGGSGSVGRGPHGFLGVFPGRHVVTSVSQGYPATATMALHPNEAYCLRLDGTTITWNVCARSETEAILKHFANGALTLLPYTHTVAAPLVQRELPRTAKKAVDQCLFYLKSALTNIERNDSSSAQMNATAAGNSLLGVPLPSYKTITTFIGFQSFEFAKRGKLREAWELLQIGLYVLPDNPTLLAALGQFQLGTGAVEGGRTALLRALEREAGLDDALRAQSEALLAGV